VPEYGARLRIVGSPGPTARAVHGRVDGAIRRALAQSDRFLTVLPRVRVADAQQLGAKKQRLVQSALSAWPEGRAAARAFFAGKIEGFGPHHDALLLLGDARALEPATALTEAGLWAPPGGWEDLVLLRGEQLLGWSHTHESLSVFAASLLDPSQGSEPVFATEVQIQGERLPDELTRALLGGAVC